MDTFEIAAQVLENYKNERLKEERIESLLHQAKTQLEEIAGNPTLYQSFLEKVQAPTEVDPIVLWVLLMSDEEICSTYIEAFDKEFDDTIPISDLADLLIYLAHLHKYQNQEIAGYAYLSEYHGGNIDDVDQYAFTNALLYIQKSKEVEISF